MLQFPLLTLLVFTLLVLILSAYMGLIAKILEYWTKINANMSKNKLIFSIFSKLLTGTLMQIWTSTDIFVFT